MAFLKSLRDRFFKWQVKRKMKKKSVSRYWTPLEEARSIGILFIVRNRATLQSLEQWIQEWQGGGRTIEALGYWPHKRRPPQKVLGSPTIQCITPSDINWWYRPAGRTVKTMIDKEYDLLLNIFREECPPLEYMAALSKARLRVGMYRGDFSLHYNDFLVDMPDTEAIDPMIEQIQHYLSTQNTYRHAKI